MFQRIEIDPRRCGGTPVIKGTRIPVAIILEQLAGGEAWENLLEGYPELSREARGAGSGRRQVVRAYCPALTPAPP